MFTLALLDFLQTDVAVDVLTLLQAEALSDQNHLAWAVRLRKTFTVAQVGVLLETARLRQKAVAKFSTDAARMVFTADALEQASHPLVVRYGRTARFATLTDVCCGIGTDSMGFARAGVSVQGIDLDPIRVAMARWNSAALGLACTFDTGDATQPISTDGTIFFDPGRRENGRRLHHVEQYQPPLSTLRGWSAGEIIVKLSPAVDLAELAPYAGRLRFISVRGELKEALLTVSPTEISQREALVIADDDMSHLYQALAIPDAHSVSAPLAYLIEPDAAIIRAGLVQDIAYSVGAYQMDSQIAYLTSDQPVLHPAVRQWRILDWMPFHVKNLRAYLRQRGFGTITVKKRASPVTPEALIAQLKPQGANACVVVLTRYRDAPIMIVCAEA